MANAKAVHKDRDRGRSDCCSARPDQANCHRTDRSADAATAAVAVALFVPALLSPVAEVTVAVFESTVPPRNSGADVDRA